MKAAMPMPRWMPCRRSRACSSRSSVIAHALDEEIEAALMRQVLELDAAGADGGIGVVRE